MADSRENIYKAVAGDIICLYDSGNFQIGDTIYTGKKAVAFPPLPQFTPELFMKVSPKNVMKQKSFHKGMQQLVDRKSTRLNSSHVSISYAVFCLKKKKSVQ